MPWEAFVLIAYITADFFAAFWSWIKGEWVEVTTGLVWLALVTHVVLIICVIRLAERIS